MTTQARSDSSFIVPRSPFLPCLLLLLAALLAAPAQSLSQPRARRALVVSLDGLDVRYLRDADRLGLKIPTLRRLMARGAWAREGVVSVYPSVTYPAHTTIVTGARPSRHGVVANSVFEPPPAPQTGAWHWFARDVRADALWDAARRARLTTALISWPVSTGAGDWSVPEIWKVGTNPYTDLRQTLAEIKKHARPAGLVEEIERRDPSLYSNATKDEGDDMRTRWAEYVLEVKRPHLTLVHLFDFDHYQHDYGPFTPQALASLEKLDGYVARLLAASERAGTLAETAVFVVSDHGFLPVTKQIHPGVILARDHLLLKLREGADAAGRVRAVVADWRVLPHAAGGACAIMLRDPDDAGALNRAVVALRDYADTSGGLSSEGAPLFRILDRAEIRRRGANPNAAVMLEAADGYHFGSNLTGEVVTKSRELGTHGFLPDRPDYRASLIVSGAAVTRRGSLGEVRMIDIGPTIARALGLRLRDAEGRPLRLR